MSWPACITCGAGACIGPRATCPRVPEAALSEANRALFAEAKSIRGGAFNPHMAVAFGFPELEQLLNAVRAQERERTQRADINVLAATVRAAGGLVRVTPQHFADIPLLVVQQTIDPHDRALVLTATCETRQ